MVASQGDTCLHHLRIKTGVELSQLFTEQLASLLCCIGGEHLVGGAVFRFCLLFVANHVILA
ncbi:MAG TPA: hypothetical protein DEQ20_00550 [Desulfobulbaceae bacterium]|nr:hypothetical protein [Desulfobulbaceae bacterium]